MAKRIESPSSINTYKQCPRKYYYQYIAKYPTIPNIHQIRGNIVHSTLENFYNIDVSGIPEQDYSLKFQEIVQKLFLFYWQEYKPKLSALNLNKDQEQFYFEETMLMLLNWTNHFIKDIKNTIAIKSLSLADAFHTLTPIREKELQSETYAVRGFIDAIHQVDDQVHIIDYKTNSSIELKDSIKLQLAIYSLLYYETYGKLPSKVGIFFLRHKLKLLNVDEQLLELAKKEIEFIHRHTSKTDHIDDYPRCVGSLCKWSTGQCDFFDICKPFEKK